MAQTATSAYRRLMAHVARAGIHDTTSRCEVATRLLGRTVTSYTGLSRDEIDTLCDAFRVWGTIQHERYMNGALAWEAEHIQSLYTTTSYDGRTPAMFSLMKGQRRMSTRHHPTVDFAEAVAELERTTKRKAIQLESHIGRWSNDDIIPAPTVSLGCSLGVGGLPRGSVMHLWGREHAGKTMLSIHFMREAQRMGIPVVLMDMEAAAQPEFMELLGVDVHKLTIVRPGSIETLSKWVYKLAGSGALIVIDSVGATESAAEFERDVEKDAARVGGTALQWKRMLNVSRPTMQESGTSIILINQVRAKFGAGMYEEQDKPSGSTSILHGSDISIKVGAVSEKSPTLKKRGWKNSSLRFDKCRYSGDMAKTIKIPFKPGYPYNRELDFIRFSEEAITQGSSITFGELSATLWKGYSYDPVGSILKNNSRGYTIVVDSVMMSAILSDDPSFDAVEVVPDETWKPGDEVPDVQVLPNGDNDSVSSYYTLPASSELAAAGWMTKHPEATRVLCERMLSSLNRRREAINSEL